MKAKNIFILFGVFVVLMLAAVIINGMAKREEKKADKESILFPGFAADRVSSVEIKAKDGEVRLNREGDAWLVATSDNYPADQEAVGKMLQTVTELKSTLIASRSAEKHSQFEVDVNGGVEVAMLGAGGEDALARLFVGKMGADYMSTYVRRADQDAVLLADGYLRSVFDKGARGWRDRTIFNFKTDQVQKLTLAPQEKEEIVIEARDSGGWQIIKPEIAPAEKDEVDSILREVSKLSADEFAEKKEPSEQTDGTSEAERIASSLEEYKLADPQSKVTVDLKDGSLRILHIGDEFGQRYYVKREGKDTVFLVSKSKIDRIFRNLEDLKAEIEEEETPRDE